jgi:FixJ family two-component response regulator
MQNVNPLPVCLIVDDSVMVRSSLARLVNRLGYAVATAVSAEDAIMQLMDLDVACVVTDLEMPGRDGTVVADVAESRGIPCWIYTGAAWKLAGSRYEPLVVDKLDFPKLASELSSLRP